MSNTVIHSQFHSRWLVFIHHLSIIRVISFIRFIPFHFVPFVPPIKQNSRPVTTIKYHSLSVQFDGFIQKWNPFSSTQTQLLTDRISTKTHPSVLLRLIGIFYHQNQPSPIHSIASKPSQSALKLNSIEINSIQCNWVELSSIGLNCRCTTP